jgi:hypothetical protein
MEVFIFPTRLRLYDDDTVIILKRRRKLLSSCRAFVRALSGYLSLARREVLYFR